MADQSIETQTTGLGGRLVNSIVGVGIGALLFTGSFVVLYLNEGRYDISGLASAAPEISANEAGAGNHAGQLVSLSGAISGSEPLGDGLFVKAGPYVVLKRQSEIFGWVQKSETRTEKNLGGSETKTTTYTYTRDWRELPEDSSKFHDPEGHLNPVKTVASQEYRPRAATVGTHQLEMSGLGLPAGETLQPGDENFIAAPGASLPPGSSWVYQGKGNLGAPVTGDLRIRYLGLKNGTPVTVLGKLGQDGGLSTFRHENGERLYRVFLGSHEDAVATLKSEFKALTWILRGAGFAMMWIGMMLFLGPVEVLLDIVPFLGSVARGIGGVLTFPVSLALTGATILVSKILHNPIAVAVTAVAVLGVAAYLFKKKQRPQAQSEQKLLKAS